MPSSDDFNIELHIHDLNEMGDGYRTFREDNAEKRKVLKDKICEAARCVRKWSVANNRVPSEKEMNELGIQFKRSRKELALVEFLRELDDIIDICSS